MNCLAPLTRLGEQHAIAAFSISDMPVSSFAVVNVDRYAASIRFSPGNGDTGAGDGKRSRPVSLILGACACLLITQRSGNRGEGGGSRLDESSP